MMSADNGVYVLVSPMYASAPRVYIADEFRVAYAQAIENIDDPQEGLKYERMLFGEATVFYEHDEAILAAHKLAERIGYIEYGVKVIKRDHPFPTR